MNKSPLIDQFKDARRVSTPIVAISTPDPAATIAAIAEGVGESAPALTQWDAVRGMTPLDQAGTEALKRIPSAAMLINPVDALIQAAQLPGTDILDATGLPAKSILFVHNAPRLLTSGDAISIIQAIWNLRDLYKGDGRTLVLLGPHFALPEELSNDVLLINEPLPDVTQLENIVVESFQDAGKEPPSAEVRDTAVSALLGLAAFQSEQITAMSLTRDGLDMTALWEHKRQTIESIPGLSVWRGQEKFSDIGGLSNIKGFINRIIHGAESPRAFLFIDEIEKGLSGATEGASDGGVSRDQLGTLLSQMEDNQWTGIICIGPPGTSKSVLAKAAGNEAGVPTISLDLGAMKGSLVGESEQKLRTGFKVVKAMAGTRVFFIATSNSVATLPLELRRRFTLGTYFFDLPTPAEREEIWALWSRKFGLKLESVDDANWSGAEIRQCCDIAYRLGSSLPEAARYVVPVAISGADQIERLRAGASGKFISASEPGYYQYQSGQAPSAAPRRRSIALPQEN